MAREDNSLPAPVAVAVGLAKSGVDSVRRLPASAVRLPVMMVGYALIATERVRREYVELEQRGRALLGHRHEQPLGVQLEEPEGGADFYRDAVERAGSSALERVGDGLRSAADQVEDAAERVVGELREDVAEADGDREGAGSGNGAGAGEEPIAALPPAPGDEQSASTPQQSEPSYQRHDSAADAETLSEVAAAVAETPPPTDVATLRPDQLPLPDFDHMTLGSLRGRLRRLDLEELVVLRDWEKAHADRLPIVTMLDNRIAKLHRDAEQGVAVS